MFVCLPEQIRVGVDFNFRKQQDGEWHPEGVSFNE
jgi:hypothetical protein